ncbi:hypothetical protein [Kitasatospora sp. NPDC091276]|uniref:hypothetical protein n=1 Tax=Kitasatospora sp. NPDC091276 TaxID=3155300 RepID=UPI00342DA319
MNQTPHQTPRPASRPAPRPASRPAPLAAACTALALALTAGGCAATGGGGGDTSATPGPLMQPAQALHRLDDLLQEATSGIQPALRYRDAWPDWREQYAKGLDEHSLGYATATRERHVTTRVAPAKYGALLDAVRGTWQTKGYRLTTGPDSVAATTPDGASLGITIHPYAGNIDISAAVGPIPLPHGADPFGTPTPEPTLPGGNPDILPAYDDPYWST